MHSKKRAVTVSPAIDPHEDLIIFLGAEEVANGERDALTSKQEDGVTPQAERHDGRSLVLLHIILVAAQGVPLAVVVDQGHIWLPSLCCNATKDNCYNICEKTMTSKGNITARCIATWHSGRQSLKHDIALTACLSRTSSSTLV